MDLQAETPKKEDTDLNGGTSRKMSDLSFDERMLLHAIRERDKDETARVMVRMMLKGGSTPAEVLQAALDTDDADTVRAFTQAVNGLINPKPTVWTYERRLALHIIGAMAVDFPGLQDEVFANCGEIPSTLHGLIDTIGAALIDGMHVLGSPDDLSLAQILDYASTFNSNRSIRAGGAK